jgi:hypothetical protein
MAQATPSQGYKAWLEKQAQPQEDGSYLARPWGYRSGVYQIDAATKRRWVAFRRACRWLTLAVVVLFVALAGEDDPWASPRVIVAGALTFGALMMVGYGGLFVIFRHARRVPKDRWKGPAIVDRWGLVPRGRYLWSMAIWGFFIALFAFTAPVRNFWQNLLFILLFAALFLLSLFSYWRAGQRPAEPGSVLLERTARLPTRRTWLAILVAPSATALVTIIFMLVPLLDGHSNLDLTGRGVRLFVLAVLGGSYALSYTLGVPIYWLARRRDWRMASAYMGGAFLMGPAAFPVMVVMGLIWAAILGPDRFWGAVHAVSDGHGLHGIHWALGVVPFGLLTMPIGLLFWLIARPDRSA